MSSAATACESLLPARASACGWPRYFRLGNVESVADVSMDSTDFHIHSRHHTAQHECAAVASELVVWEEYPIAHGMVRLLTSILSRWTISGSSVVRSLSGMMPGLLDMAAFRCGQVCVICRALDYQVCHEAHLFASYVPATPRRW